MYDELIAEADQLIIDIKGMQDDYDKAINKKNAEIDSLIAQIKEASAKCQINLNACNSIKNKIETVNAEINSIKNKSSEAVKSISNDTQKVIDKQASFENVLNNIKTTQASLQSKTDSLSYALNKLAENNIKIQKQQESILATQMDLAVKQNMLGKKYAELTDTFNLATDKLRAQINQSDSALNDSLSRIDAYSQKIENIKSEQVENYRVATDEAKKLWEKAILNIINDRIEIVEEKEGMFKKKYIFKIRS